MYRESLGIKDLTRLERPITSGPQRLRDEIEECFGDNGPVRLLSWTKWLSPGAKNRLKVYYPTYNDLKEAVIELREMETRKQRNMNVGESYLRKNFVYGY